MSREYSIEAPYTLVTLPQPFDPTTGTTQASPVHGYKGQKRRKRPEIAVNVDGEGITIFNVRNPGLVTSYAFSPQARFLCSPCSILRRIRKSESGKFAQRLTYVAISDKSGKGTELVCLVEEAQRNSKSDSSAANQTKLTHKLPAAKSPIRALSAVAVDPQSEQISSAFDICIVFENGEVTCVSGDLAEQRWQATSEQVLNRDSDSRSTTSIHVESAIFTDLDTSRRGLLKSRDDALAGLETNDNRTLLTLVTLSRNEAPVPTSARELRVFSLPPRSKDAIHSLQQGLHQILAYELPATVADGSEAGPTDYSLHASSGRLHQLLSGSITTFDLTGTLPRIISTLSSQAGGYHSYTRISPSSVIASETESCGIYDTTYSSTQAAVRLSREERLPASNKRKRSEGQAADERVRFISCFAELGMAVAIRGRVLVGMQILHQQTSNKRSKHAPSLLVDSLGKGMQKGSNGAAQAVLSKDAVAAKDEDWEHWKTVIDGFVDQDDVTGFEKHLARELDVPLVKPAGSRTRNIDTNPNGTTNGVNGDTEDGIDTAPPTNGHVNGEQQDVQSEWRFPKDTATLVRRTNREKATYCLSKIFAHFDDGSSPTALAIAFFAPNALKWLALTGYLSSGTIQRSLHNTTSQQQSGELIRAMHDFDPSLTLMHDVLGWPIYLDIYEVVQALKIVVQSLEEQPTSETLQLTNGQIEDGDEKGELEDALMQETEAADADLDFAIASLNDGLAIRSLTLRAVFARLHSFPSKQILQAFRAMLSQREIVFFIHLLRVELAGGGWTYRYVDVATADADPSDGPSDRAIVVISNLLNIAIDAVGTSGWLVGLSSDFELSTDDMLSMLRAEASAALESCHEAQTLSTYLNDLERYSNMLRDPANGGSRKRRQIDPVRNPGFLVQEDADDPVLPLGMKVKRIEKTRTTAGGQMRVKSKGAVGREISMKVGKYSIDRIRV